MFGYVPALQHVRSGAGERVLYSLFTQLSTSGARSHSSTYIYIFVLFKRVLVLNDWSLWLSGSQHLHANKEVSHYVSHGKRHTERTADLGFISPGGKTRE